MVLATFGCRQNVQKNLTVRPPMGIPGYWILGSQDSSAGRPTRDLWSSDFGISGILKRISEQTSANPEIGSKSEIWSSDLESPAPPSSAQLSSAPPS